jgi:hypothetical protein
MNDTLQNIDQAALGPDLRNHVIHLLPCLGDGFLDRVVQDHSTFNVGFG